MAKLNIKIEGQSYQVEEGLTILEAARGAGIEISTLCYLKGLTPTGACGICAVEVEEDGEIIHKGDEIVDIVARVRQFKSENQISLKTQIEELSIATNNLDFVKDCEYDIKAVTGALKLNLINAKELDVKFGKIVVEEN